MSGYGWYVFFSYASVAGFLLLQWYFPWRRWKQYLRKIKNHE